LSLAGLPNVNDGAPPSDGFGWPKSELDGAVVAEVPKRLLLGLGASDSVVAGADTKRLGVEALVLDVAVDPNKLLVGAAVVLGVGAVVAAADPNMLLLGAADVDEPKMLDLGVSAEATKAVAEFEDPKRLAVGFAVFSPGFWPKGDGMGASFVTGLLPNRVDC
jgi:hypothetical protein